MNKKNAGPFAWLTLLLVGVQLAVFAAAWWGSPPRALFDALPASALVRWGGNFAPATMEGEWWRLAAHRFIQTDLISLLVVGSAFWSAGATAERIFGRCGLAIVFFGTSIATGLASLAFNSPTGVAVGAGAVVLGIFAALVSYAIAVRSPSPWPYLRPMRYTGPVFLAWLVWVHFVHRALDLPSSSVALLTGFLLGMTLAPLESAPDGARPPPGPWLAPLAVVVMICGALWTQVKPPPYYASELRQAQATVRNFERTNIQLADRIDDFLRRASASAIPNPVLADELRDQHLPAWRSLRGELGEAAARRELPLADRLALAKRYVEARIAYLENASEALRSGEPERLAAVPRLEAEVARRLDALREHAAGKRTERAATQD